MPSPESFREKQEDAERLRSQNFVFRGQINPDLEKVSQREGLEDRTNLFLTNYADSTLDLDNEDLLDWDLGDMHEALTKCLHHLRRLEYDTDIITKLESQLEEVKIALDRKTMRSALRP